MRKRSTLQMVVIGLLAGAATAVVAVFVPWLPQRASEEAGPVDSVIWTITIICVVIFAIVAGVSVYSVYKFRARPDDPEDGSPIHGNTGLEIFWTAVPTALVTAITIYSGIVLTNVEDIPDDHLVVEVTAQQFAWSFRYPADVEANRQRGVETDVASGELVLPIGEPVELRMQSLDVIHSFWVPEWRMKQDTVPGIETKVRITPNELGTYSVICTELCGLGHSTMRSRAQVVDQGTFEEWLDEQEQQASADEVTGS